MPDVPKKKVSSCGTRARNAKSRKHQMPLQTVWSLMARPCAGVAKNDNCINVMHVQRPNLILNTQMVWSTEEKRGAFVVCLECTDKGYSPYDLEKYTCVACKYTGGHQNMDTSQPHNYNRHATSYLVCSNCKEEECRILKRLREKEVRELKLCRG